MSGGLPERGLHLVASSGDRFHFSIEPASPFFAGHFPGRPILPGVAHLALVARGLSELAGREVGLAEVRTLKLRRPVDPGDELELRLGAPGADGAVRFEIRGGAGPVSQGTVVPDG